MSVRSVLSLGLWVLVVVAVFSLIVGQALGQPVLLGFVTSDSMAPALEAGDGFVAIPAQIAGPIDEGDVIVFRAEEVNRGQLTTHRIVEKTDRGYITKGDANPFADQDSGEPPVKDAQVVAKALQLDGGVVAIPYLGTAVQGIQGALSEVQRRLAILFGTRFFLGVQGLAYLFFLATLAWYLVGVWRDRNSRRRERDRSRETGTSVRLVVAGFALLVVAGATLAMVVPAGTQEFGVVSAEFDSPGPRIIPTGESESFNYTVANGGVLPVVSYLEPGSEGITVTPRELSVDARAAENATVTLQAPPETGFYRRFLVEHRYLAILPQSVIRGLYEVHPWAPIAAIDALIGVPFYLLGIGLVGTGRVRSRARDGPSTLRRLRSRLT